MSDFQANEKCFYDFYKSLDKVIIPFNQRSFAWKEHQIYGFLEDLLHCVDNNKNHFLGTIITTKNSDNRGYVDVIDGQQRLTAFFIFNAALTEIGLELIRDHKEFTLKETDNSSIHEYANRVNDKKDKIFSYFGHLLNTKMNAPTQLKILPSWHDVDGYNYIIKSIDSLYKITNFDYLEQNSKSTSSIKPAYKKVKKSLKNNLFTKPSNLNIDNDIERIIKCLDCLHENFKFIDVYVVDGEPNTIFDNLNTRGEPLSTLDVIRNSVFSELQRNNKLQKLFHKDWMRLEEKFLEPFNSNVLKYANKDEDALSKLQSNHIKNYWFPFGLTLNSSLSNKKMNSQIRLALNAISKGDDMLEKCRKKVQEIARYIPLYNAITENFYDKNIRNYPENLKDKIFMLYRINCPSNAYPFIFKSVDRYFKVNSEKERNDILEAFNVLESRIMRDSIDGKTPAKDFLHTLYKKIEIHDFDYSLTRFFMKTKSYPFPKDKEVEEIFKENTFDKFSRISYLLEEWELSRLSTPTLKNSFLKLNYNESNSKDLEVDHFMPQNNENWKSYLEKNDFVLTDKEYSKLIGKIGNLFLLHKATNSRKKNKDFEDAKKVIADDKQTNIHDYVKNLKKWTPTEIEIRTNEIISFFKKRWPEYPSHNTVNHHAEQLKFDIENEYKNKYESIFAANKIEIQYVGLTINNFERNSITLNTGIKEFLIKHEIINEKSLIKGNYLNINAKFFDDIDFSEKLLKIYPASRSKSKEILFSIERIAEIAKPYDVLGIFVMDKKIYISNLSNIKDIEAKLRLI